jgi:hypothetical protein
MRLSNTGIGKLDLIIKALKYLKSIQNLHEPSFFLTKRIGDENILELG